MTSTLSASAGIHSEPDTSAGRRPTISVILPVYNRSASLPLAIESVLAQVPPADELIVVDDGSTEDLSPVLSRYEGRIRLHRKPNGGAASARNAGARLATGDWLAFIDSDGEWAAGHMATVHRDLVGAADDIVVHLGDTRFKGPGYDQSMFAIKRASYPNDHAVRVERPIGLIISGMPPEAAAVRRAVFERIGGFDETMRIAEDTALFGRLLREGAFLVTGQELVTTYRLEDDPIALTGLEKREPVYARQMYIRTLEAYLDLDLTERERRMVTGRLSGARLRLAQAETVTGTGSPRATLISAAKVHPKPLVGWSKSAIAAVFGARGYAWLLDRRPLLDRS